MKMTNYLTMLFVFLLYTAQIYSAVNPDLDDRTKTFTVSKGGTLTAKIDPGRIEIKTWERNEVQVIAKGIEQRDMDKLETRLSGNKLTIRYEARRNWSQSIHLVISAPKEFSYELNTTSGEIDIVGSVKGMVDLVTMSGEISIDDVVGDVFLKTYGGEINTGNLEGKVKLNTQGGSIRVGNIKKGPANIETMGGEVRIRNVESGLDLTTYGGDIEVGDIGGNADITTYGGDIKVNNVGGSADLETYGGDIKLRSASGTVKASTNGGDLVLYNITGTVDAQTSAGDIYVELTPSGKGRSRLESSIGSIELVIPANAKATIEAEIKLQGYGRSRDTDCDIFSDYDPVTYDEGKKGKGIYATYELNGGGEKIYLKTVNSNIEIRKAKK